QRSPARAQEAVWRANRPRGRRDSPLHGSEAPPDLRWPPPPCRAAPGYAALVSCTRAILPDWRSRLRDRSPPATWPAGRPRILRSPSPLLVLAPPPGLAGVRSQPECYPRTDWAWPVTHRLVPAVPPYAFPHRQLRPRAAALGCDPVHIARENPSTALRPCVASPLPRSRSRTSRPRCAGNSPRVVLRR